MSLSSSMLAGLSLAACTFVCHELHTPCRLVCPKLSQALMSRRRAYRAEDVRDIPWLLAHLTVQLVTQDGGLAIHFLARAHDVAQRTMLLGDTPGRHRGGVLQREILISPDVLLRQAQLCDGHKRGERLLPQLPRLLHGHPCQIDAELDLE